MFVCEKNKFNNSYLDSVDWNLYLEREQEIFLFSCDFPLYGTRLKKEMGIGFDHLLVYFKDNKIVFNYSELNPFDNFNIKDKNIKGVVAFNGKAVGRVKIVNTVKQMLKLNRGDVLVSINTNPALMPAIKKSVAIITNEGGITCHAAIIARELKKPCIIGTKIATKVLRDGDLVEVDAERGGC
ncbi:MAG: PEP-utilizing enzyme [bacterium]